MQNFAYVVCLKCFRPVWESHNYLIFDILQTTVVSLNTLALFVYLKVYQKCQTIGDFVKSLEGRIKGYGESAHKLDREQHPLHKEVSETHEAMMEAWKSCLEFSEHQLAAILSHDNYYKSMKVMLDQVMIIVVSRRNFELQHLQIVLFALSFAW